jgi:hypothetical protein
MRGGGRADDAWNVVGVSLTLAVLAVFGALIAAMGIVGGLVVVCRTAGHILLRTRERVAEPRSADAISL